MVFLNMICFAGVCFLGLFFVMVLKISEVNMVFGRGYIFSLLLI